MAFISTRTLHTAEAECSVLHQGEESPLQEEDCDEEEPPLMLEAAAAAKAIMRARSPGGVHAKQSDVAAALACYSLKCLFLLDANTSSPSGVGGRKGSSGKPNGGDGWREGFSRSLHGKKTPGCQAAFIGR